jgi:hypothetical protein
MSATSAALSLLLTFLCFVQTLAGEEKITVSRMKNLPQQNSNTQLAPSQTGLGG